MKALVYHGLGKKAWEEKPKPIINKTNRCRCKNFKNNHMRNRSAYYERRRARCY